MSKVKFKKLHEDAVLPTYAKPGDGGMDITAVSDGELVTSKENEESYYYIEYRTGLAMELPEGMVALILPRSSISNKALILSNSVGLIDEKYRGEVRFRFKIDAGLVIDEKYAKPSVYKKGDRIGQLMIIPYKQFETEFVDDLSETERGQSGFGSSGA